jgi:hypothetical protein
LRLQHSLDVSGRQRGFGAREALVQCRGAQLGVAEGIGDAWAVMKSLL